MAIVRKLEEVTLERESKHTEVDCTVAIVESNGEKFLQIDTYGSSHRKILGKKSQSIRITGEAIEQLRQLLRDRLY